jgi:hypothetical protein
MRNLKRTLLAGLAFALFSGVGLGQPVWAGGYGGSDTPKAEMKKYEKYHKYDPKEALDKMSKKLNLTAEQKEKIWPLLSEKAKAWKDLHNEYWDKKMKLGDDYHAKVREYLNPDQQKKYDEMAAKWKEECKKYHEKYEKGYEGSGKK